MAVEFSPQRILSVLDKHHVRYVLVGGMAATLHGSALITDDVDITPERARANLDGLSEALTELGAVIRTDAVPEGVAFRHSGESLDRADIWNLATDAGALDITFLPAGTSGYKDLRKDAEEIEVFGLTIVVASLADVVRSKEAAGREKDLRALPTLRRLLDEDRG